MSTSRQQGRPRIHSEEEVRQRVLSAFEQLLEREDTSTFSTAEIARQAGVSKRTLYQVAPTKRALIQGVMERARIVPLSVLDEPVDSPAAASELLERFLFEWMTAAFASTGINMVRLAMDEWRKAPELGAYYSEAGGVYTAARLATWLEDRRRAGHLAIADSAEVADVCRAVLIKQHLFSVAFGHRPAPAPAEMRQRIAALMSLLRLRAER